MANEQPPELGKFNPAQMSKADLDAFVLRLEQVDMQRAALGTQFMGTISEALRQFRRGPRILNDLLGIKDGAEPTAAEAAATQGPRSPRASTTCRRCRMWSCNGSAAISCIGTA